MSGVKKSVYARCLQCGQLKPSWVFEGGICGVCRRKNEKQAKRNTRAFKKRAPRDIRNTEWYSRARAAALIRADGQCEFCGKRRRLTVHHLDTVKGHSKSACDSRNMVAICETCRVEIHSWLRNRAKTQPRFTALTKTLLPNLNT